MAGHVSASAQRGVERRARILDAALELFAEQGFILTSLPMIAERVGITHAGILHHFGSKEGVLRALLEREGPVPHFSAWVLNESGADVIAKLPEYAELVIEYPLEMELQFQLFWENRHQEDPMHEELLFDIDTDLGGREGGKEYVDTILSFSDPLGDDVADLAELESLLDDRAPRNQ